MIDTAILKKEEARLLSILGANSDYLKLLAVRHMIRLYSSNEASSTVPDIQEIEPPRDEIPSPAQRKTRKFTPENLDRLNMIETFLRERGQRVQSQAILEMLEQKGLGIKTLYPVNSLSHLMNADERFDMMRGTGGGYGLAIWNGENGFVVEATESTSEQVVEQQEPTQENVTESTVADVLFGCVEAPVEQETKFY